MPGVKGKSGAPGRPRKAGPGRPLSEKPLTRIMLDSDHAAKLSIVTKSRRHLTGNMQLSQRQVVESWIDEAWAEIDQAIEERSES